MAYDRELDRQRMRRREEESMQAKIEYGFKMFVVGTFLIGAPLTIALLSVAIVAMIGKGIFNYKKGKKEPTPNELTKAVANEVKKNAPDKAKGLVEELKALLNLSKDENGKELSKDAFIDKLKGIVKEYSNTPEGKEILGDVKFKNVVDQSFGPDASKEVDKAVNEETLTTEGETKTVTLEDFLKDENLNEKGQPVNREGELEERETDADILPSDENINEYPERESLDIPDDLFDKEVATKDDIEKEQKQNELDLSNNKEVETPYISSQK